MANAVPPVSSREFGKADYLALRARLSFEPSVWPTLGILGGDAVLIALANAGVKQGGAALFALSQIALAIVFFHGFGVLHECGHGSASRSRIVNDLLGLYASTFCFIPYFPWKYIHQKHHAWTGNIERDPVLKSLRSWRERRVPWIVRMCWRSWVPLGALLQHLVYWTYPLVMLKAGELSRTKLLRTSLSFVWLFASYAALHLALPALVTPAHLALGFGVYLAAEELVNIPHHVDVATFDGKLPVWAQYRATRSCYYPRGLSELLVLNFNFHIEHHLFPSLPWYRLRSTRALLKAELGSAYQEAIGIRFNIEGRKRSLDSIVDRYRTT